MSDAQTPAAPALTDGETVVVTLTASHTFLIYSQAAVLLALAERQAVDINRVFEFSRLNASILRQAAAATTGGKLAVQGLSRAAAMLDELESTIRNMTTKPPGSGDGVARRAAESRSLLEAHRLAFASGSTAAC